MTAAETMGMELAYQIQKRLYESSLTAEAFAQQCGVPEELVAQAMEEESIPIEAVQKICDTLGISVDSLRRMPVSGNFVELQRLVLDIIQERPAAGNSLPDEVKEEIFTAARRHANDILNQLRELQVDLRSNPAVFIGGGSVLLQPYLSGSPLAGKAEFIDSPNANAVGYEMLGEKQLARLRG